MSHVHGVDGIRRALGEGEEIDGVEDVGLALAVAADEAVDFGRERHFRFCDVLIVEYAQSFQNHAAKVDKKTDFSVRRDKDFGFS